MIRSMNKLALVCLLMVAACAPATRWSRPDTADAQRLADEKNCEEIAAEQALDESFASGPKYPPYRDTQFILDGGGEDGGSGPVASYSRRGPRQYELAVYCMEQRGSKLVPVE